MAYVMFKGATCMVVANQGFREFFQGKGYKSYLKIDGGNLAVSSDDKTVTVKNGMMEIQSYLTPHDGNSYFKLPRGVRKYVIGQFKDHFTVDQFVKFFSTEGKEIVQKVLNFVPESKEAKFKSAFDKVPDKDLLKLFKKFEQGWSGGISELIRFYPRRVLPFLMNTSDKYAREALDKRIREGT